MAYYPQSQDPKAVEDVKPVLFKLLLLLLFLTSITCFFFLYVQQYQMYTSSSLSPCFI